MSLKDILVCLDPTDDGEARLQLAAAIAREWGAHLSAAYVAPEAIPGAAPPDGPPLVPPTSRAWLPPAGIASASPAEAEATARAQTVAEIIEERFRETVRPHALEGDWHRFGAGEGSELVALLAAVDLVVYGQTAPDWRPPTGFRPDDIVVDGGRPTLVVPYAGRVASVGRRGLIAWDGTREAARALHAAMPLMAKAEAVMLMTVREHEADFERDAPGTARLVRHLARHGISAGHEETLRGDVPVADLLLSRAADLDIDLIVSGAYHHSLTREVLLGGVSRDLLDHMTVPVLMSH